MIWYYWEAVNVTVASEKLSNVAPSSMLHVAVILAANAVIDINKATKKSFSMVGLPDKAVSEAKERVRSALQAFGIAFGGWDCCRSV